MAALEPESPLLEAESVEELDELEELEDESPELDLDSDEDEGLVSLSDLAMREPFEDERLSLR